MNVSRVRKIIYTAFIGSQVFLYALMSFVMWDIWWIEVAGKAAVDARIGGLILWSVASVVVGVIVAAIVDTLGYFRD